MKRITACLLAAVLLFGMTACGGDPTTAAPTTTMPQQTTQTTPIQTEPPMTHNPTQPPQPTQVNVSVTLEQNDGSGKTETIVVNADRIEALPEPGREGYVFLGWYTQPEGGEQVETGMALDSSQAHTLYAHWEVKTVFTVTFDPNGGRVSPYYSEMMLKNGEVYGELPEPMREGYRFLGWYTKPEKGSQVRGTTKFTGDQDLTLYAHWEYDALLYWRHVLDSRVQQIPQCRRVVVYLERNAGYKTYIDCPFLTDAGAINPAEGLEEYKVTDEWIKSVQPYIIVKLTKETDMGLVAKTGMLRRFPDAEVYVFSTSAVSGSEKYQLYCRLYLAKLLYPEYFEDVDLDAVKAELKVKATIYY